MAGIVVARRGAVRVRVGVVFYSDGAWMHCALTDGTVMVDSVPGQAVKMRPLRWPHQSIIWLDHSSGARAWSAAMADVGTLQGVCSAWICRCLDAGCYLPTGLWARVVATGQKT